MQGVTGIACPRIRCPPAGQEARGAGGHLIPSQAVPTADRGGRGSALARRETVRKAAEEGARRWGSGGRRG